MLRHCWLGHVTRKTVSEITHNVLSGTLNTTVSITLQVLDANSGRTTMTHADASWTTDGGQVDCPVHVAVDSDGFIYVLDGQNRCIQLFDSDLRHVRDLLDAQRGLKEPRRMCVDGQSGRLYVAEGAGSVLVYDII